MNYGEILTATWTAVWKHKSILGFGVLSMLGPALIGIPFGVLYLFLDPYELMDFFGAGNAGMFLVLGMTLLSLLLSLLFAGLGYAGVLMGTRLADEGAESLPFAELWTRAWPYVGRILALFLLWTVVFGTLAFIPVMLGFLTAGVAFLCLMPFIFLLIPVMLVAYLYLSLVMAAVAGDDLGIGDALRRGWNLMRARFWPLVLMMLILYLLLFAVNMIASLPVYLLQFLLIIPSALMEMTPDDLFRILGLMMMILIPLTSALQGLGMGYFFSAWMIVYRRLTRPAEPVPA